MNNILSAIAGVAGITFAIFSLFEMKLDKKKQKNIVEGLEIRREKGSFDIGKYTDSMNAIKKLLWKRQRNSGPDPEKYNKKLTFIDYSDDNSQAVIVKRSIR